MLASFVSEPGLCIFGICYFLKTQDNLHTDSLNRQQGKYPTRKELHLFYRARFYSAYPTESKVDQQKTQVFLTQVYLTVVIRNDQISVNF